jgi:hypothetical protein
MRKAMVAGVLVVLLVVAVPFGAFLTARNALPAVRGLSGGQVRLAETIWARAHAHTAILGRKSGQAAIIAIAVASQESGLGTDPGTARPNRDGDAGPFQQRTKPGWYGSLAQVTNPTYAADAFLVGHTVTAAQYSAAGSEPAGPVGYHIPGLADVPGWAGMDVIAAAHHVQRSAFRDAVADDIPLARRLVATFAAAAGTGVRHIPVTTETAGHCFDAVRSSCPPSDSPGEHGLKPETLLVLGCVREAFPRIKTFYGFRPHDPFPDHPSGRAVDIMINSAFGNYRSPAAVAYGD